MAKSHDLDLFALLRPCIQFDLDRIITQHISNGKFTFAVSDYSVYLTDHCLVDAPGIPPLPDVWVDFCKACGYNTTDTIAKSAIGWLYAVHGVFISWKKHQTSCPSVSDHSSPLSSLSTVCFFVAFITCMCMHALV